MKLKVIMLCLYTSMKLGRTIQYLQKITSSQRKASNSAYTIGKGRDTISKIMSKLPDNFRLQQVPVLNIRGNNFTVGYSIGRTFKSLINDLINKWSFFNLVALPKYETEEGKMLYEKSLSLCSNNCVWRNYLEEIRGMAEGAEIPFHKLFILHVDALMNYPELPTERNSPIGVKGCTSILSNSNEVVLGHNEDADTELLNNIYIVSAEITDENEKRIEKFTTLTYAGHLPGYTMGFNHHGMIYSVNTLYPLEIYPDGSPRAFVARALLNASNIEEAVNILQDRGNGISDGLSVNLYFLHQNPEQPLMYNIEVGPGKSATPESLIDVLTLHKGDTLAHCNRYLRIKIPEKDYETNARRHKAIERHSKPTDANIVKNILSDESDPNFPVYRTETEEHTKTVAIGIFEPCQLKWKIYIGKPTATEPVAIIPLI